ncbi:hypothetical protein [Gulosibacter faecalis]|uniref:GerMN domain-containing protein n=1 Tax=Gulosibacter faecalis TaxID=272240 RepID=A0ABW5UVM9_9MICO|nr:hypothetical protein [Gulosibacter faecalis]
MIRQRMRAVAALVVALLMGFGLVACASDGDGQGTEERYSQVLVDTAMPDLDGATTIDAPDEFIELPGTRIQVTSVAEVRELPAAVASELGLSGEPVRAPDGEAFYLAEVRFSEAQNMTHTFDDASMTQVTLTVNGGDAVTSSADTCRYLSVCLVITNGSEGAAPNDVTLDAAVAGVQQQLSLVTGEATTDLTYYPAVHPEYEPVWWEFAGDPEAEEETVAGYVSAVYTSPLAGALPLPEPGSMFVGVDIEAVELRYVKDTSEVWLVLDDGTRVESANSFSAAFDEAESITWFVVPADTVEFSFEIILSANNEHRGDATQPVTLVAD